jgi:hypothetical protein
MAINGEMMILKEKQSVLTAAYQIPFTFQMATLGNIMEC